MSGLDDLRKTLEIHADTVGTDDSHARRTAVHHRIGAARRRRRATVAGAAAAVVAVAGGLALLPRDAGSAGPDPAAPVVFGVDLPAQLDSLGYGYDYVEHVSGSDGRARLRLPAAGEPRLVTWGTSGDDDAVRVAEGPSDDSSDAAVHDGEDFADWVLVAPGDSLDVSASVDEGDVALAVYSLAERPAGVTGAGLTFRQDVVDGELVTATIGEPGETDITLAATAAGRGAKVIYTCADTSGIDDLTLHTEIGGKGGGSASGGCDESLPFDGYNAESTGFATTPGEDLTTRFWFTDGPDGPVVESDDLRLAVAVYSLDADPLGEPGELVESRGHLWRKVSSKSTSGSAGASLVQDVPAGGPYLAVVDCTISESAQVDVELGKQSFGSSDGTSATFDGLVSEGETATVELTEAEGARNRLLLSFYELAD